MKPLPAAVALTALLPLTALLLCAAGCEGNLNGTPSAGSARSDDSRAEEEGANEVVSRPGFPDTAAEFSPSVRRAGRLTPSQYRASLVSLFGEGVPLPDRLDEIPVSSNSELISSGSATINQLSSVEQFERSAFDVAAWVFADTTRHEGLGLCTPASAADACIRDSLARAGRRIWRRPLSADELDQATSLAETLSGHLLDDPLRALEFSLAGLLQSPHFLYRIEQGQDAPERPGWKLLTSYEMATRLAFGLTGTTPDEQLLDAAEGGELLDVEQLARHTARLLESAETTTYLIRLLDDYLHYSELEQLVKPEVEWTESLRNSMTQEVEAMTQRAIAGGDFTELFTSGVTEVDQELAGFYGISWPGGDESSVEVTLPAGRRGVLTTAAMLARHGSAETSAILRGRFVRNVLLCGAVPDPPGDVEEPEGVDVPDGLTTSRAASYIRLETPACAGCHIPMDPLGYAFDQFDTVGRFMDEEHGVPIRSDGEFSDAGLGDEAIAFDGAEELVELLVGSPVFEECLVKNVYGRLAQREVAFGETALFAGLADSFGEEDHDLSGLIVSIVTSDGFRHIADTDDTAEVSE